VALRLLVEDRPSDSPYIARVWRNTGPQSAPEMLAIASVGWGLVFWEEHAVLRAAVVGPELHPRLAPIPDGTESFGIDFALGTVLPQLPATRQVDGGTELPDVDGRSLHLAGSRWSRPTYDNAEAFVDALVREDVLCRDRLVTEVHRGATSELSLRTVQRRFVAASGLTAGLSRQIDRARRAAILLEQGTATLDVVNELGFYDQTHLNKALRRFIGRTSSQLRDGDHPEPLSLLY
jgi:hypothetical protein